MDFIEIELCIPPVACFFFFFADLTSVANE